MWIVFLIIYGILIGFYTVLRRKATEKSDILFVLIPFYKKNKKRRKNNYGFIL